jgi:hypothetical protein
VLITTFGDGRFEINSRKLSTFKVAVNCVVSQTLAKGLRVIEVPNSLVRAEWRKIVDITRAHGNNARLAWDVFKIPHHCSYLSMAEEKGNYKTTPTPEFEWLLRQGAERSVMISTSWPIPSETTKEPPHAETYRRYMETAEHLDADLIVTMEHPSEGNPKRTIIEIGASGPTLKREIVTSSVSAVTARSPRVG